MALVMRTQLTALLVVQMLLSFVAVASDEFERLECEVQNDICIRTVEYPDRVEIYLANNDLFYITVESSANLNNMFSSNFKDGVFSVASNDEVLVGTLEVINPQEDWSYNWSYAYISGNFEAIHDDTFNYLLPFPSGYSYLVSQGFNGDFTHQEGADQYAVDYVMPEGSHVLAARGGKVIHVAEGYNGNGTTPYYFGRANFVIIEHSDGTHGEYFHLKQNSVYVEEGDLVEQGQLLGLSGNTGYSTGPHLHFAITSPVDSVTLRSYPFTFTALEGVFSEPSEGLYYTSTNTEIIEQVVDDEQGTGDEKIGVDKGADDGDVGSGSMHVLFFIFLCTVIVKRTNGFYRIHSYDLTL